MDNAELTRALREATADLQPRPSFTTAVLRGGRRRKVQHRAWVAGVAAVATAAAGTSGVALWSNLGSTPGPNDAGVASTTERTNPMLEQPTRGDLAGDQAFLDQALQAYREGITHSPNLDRGVPEQLVGEPRVYWAGNTPAGRAAIVVQGGPMPDANTSSYPEGVEPPPDWNTQRVFVGLIGGDTPKLIDEMPFISGGPRGGNAFLFGADDRVVLAFTDGLPLFVSGGLTIGPDGKVLREWQPMSSLDGVAVAELPAGSPSADVRVVRAEDPATATPDDSLIVLPASRYDKGFDRQGKSITDLRLPWPPDSVFRINGTTARPLSDMDAREVALAQAGMIDPLRRVALGGFEAVADLPGGRAVVLFEYQPDSQSSRQYAVITKPDGSVERVIHGGTLDQAATLPARVRLPDGLGWMVAHHQAQLRFRTSGDGPWQNAGTDAALLPDNAVQVEVTKPGAALVVVDLPS